MDEPLSNLDAKLRVQTRAELIELQRRFEATVVYVTHDQVEAMTMGHRIAIMNQGVLQQVDAPQDVYAKPANLFVAQFIGNPPMNTIVGKPVTADGVTGVDIPGTRVPLPDELARAIEKGNVDAVVLGVRPEHLCLDAEGVLSARVTVIESLGHERHIVCRLDDDTMVIVRQDSAEAPPKEADAVKLAAEPEHLHVFDAASGERIEP
jgi:multiple sugar transport system ATP-binding protein